MRLIDREPFVATLGLQMNARNEFAIFANIGLVSFFENPNIYQNNKKKKPKKKKKNKKKKKDKKRRKQLYVYKY